MATQQFLDIKNFAPSELAAKQGSTVVVFQPGAYELAIGKGSASTPVRVPHCIAYKETLQRSNEQQHVVRDTPRLSHVNRHTIQQAESAFAQVVNTLNLTGLIETRQAQERPRCSNLPASADSFTWLPVGGRAGSNSIAAAAPFVAGEDVLHLWHEDPYQVSWPMVEAEESVAAGGSPPQKVQDALEQLWGWALQTKLQLDRRAVSSMAAVLLVSEAVQASVVLMLADVLLRGLGFESLVVHLEPCAAAFGQGTTAACIVNVGTTRSSVCCVEDGMMVPQTLETLPFGTRHIAQALLCLLHLHNLWPDEVFEPQHRVADMAQLHQLFMDHCFLPADADVAFIEHQVREAEPAELMFRQPGQAVRRCEVGLGGLACVAPMALFVPTLLQELGILPDSSRAITAGASDDAASAVGKDRAGMMQMPQPAGTEPLHGLDAAVVRSIRHCKERTEQRQRLAANIVLVGAAAQLRGLRDMLERRVLQSLPSEEEVDMVAVLEPHETATNTVWRGAVLLALLDSRENWLTRNMWLTGGANSAHPAKLARSDSVHARLFWYCKAQHGQ